MGKKKRARTGESSRAQRKEQKRPVRIDENDDQENDDPMYDDIDLFHQQRDKITFDEEPEDESSDGGDGQEAVFDLNVPESSSEEEEEEGDDEYSSNEQETIKKSKQTSGDDSSGSEGESNEEETGDLKSWGRSKKIYYSGDTADIEIGQDIEDALDEEEAALELQRERVKTLEARDFQGSDSDTEGESEEDEAKSIGQQAKKATIGAKLKKSADKKTGIKSKESSIHSELTLPSLGKLKEGEVEAIKVERNLSELTKEDRLELILSESPELLSLLSEAENLVTEFRDTCNPLATTVTKEMGASEDGIRYLATKHELLLSFIMNILFYLLLKAEGQPVKHHPVMGQILEVRKLLEYIAPIDKQLKPQVQVLLKALSGEISVDGSSKAGEEDSSASGVTDTEEGDSSAGTEDEDANEKASASASDKEKQKKLQAFRMLAEKEEEMFMKKVSAGAKKKKQKKSFPQQSLDDFGDVGIEDDEIPSKGTNVQSVVNHLKQKSRSAKDKKEVGGDADVPFRDPKALKPNPKSQEFRNDEDEDVDLEALDEMFTGKKKHKQISSTGSDDDEDAFYKAISTMKKQKKKEKAEKYKVHKLTKEPERVKEEERRGASYEIIANRGLVAHKKKLNRNPRVKKRVAYEKAIIRRKGQVRELRTGETNMYGGELTGIRANVSRSRKIKN
mmetsp:Transcript_11287/g.14692  ORF Transcript_11287/g.14692 Transcript_11287/m.14692 type:complete len:677 (+) Transcript_11287:59-2089(+)